VRYNIAEGYSYAFVQGPIEGGYRIFSLPDFREVCLHARAGAVRSMRAVPARIDARVGVPIPYDALKVDALDGLGVLVPRVPIDVEAYLWSNVLDVTHEHSESVMPAQQGTIQLRVRTICDGPGGETFITVNVTQ